MLICNLLRFGTTLPSGVAVRPVLNALVTMQVAAALHQGEEEDIEASMVMKHLQKVRSKSTWLAGD